MKNERKQGNDRRRKLPKYVVRLSSSDAELLALYAKQNNLSPAMAIRKMVKQTLADSGLETTKDPHRQLSLFDDMEL